MALQIQSVALPTGATLQYVEQGDAAGLPVLLLHGLGDSWRSFERVLPQLPQSLRALAPTQRGHGDSSRPTDGYYAHDFAADAAALLDAFELESAVVVGHSLGSAVAQRFAIEFPQGTRGLVLIGSFASLARSPAPRELWEVVSALRDPVDESFVRAFQQSTLAQPVPPAFFEAIVQESLKLPARVWQAVVAANLQDDFADQINQIQAPTLIVWGDQDEITPRSEQETLTAAIAGSRLVVYEDAGHGLHWEMPDRLASDLVRFIETTVD